MIFLNSKKTHGRSARDSFETSSKSLRNKKDNTTQVRPRIPQMSGPHSNCNRTRWMSKKALKALGVGTVESYKHYCWHCGQ